MSINRRMEELAAIRITEFDAETHFRALAARGSAKKGLALLDKLDAAFAAKSKQGALSSPRLDLAPLPA